MRRDNWFRLELTLSTVRVIIYPWRSVTRRHLAEMIVLLQEFQAVERRRVGGGSSLINLDHDVLAKPKSPGLMPCISHTWRLANQYLVMGAWGPYIQYMDWFGIGTAKAIAERFSCTGFSCTGFSCKGSWIRSKARNAEATRAHCTSKYRATYHCRTAVEFSQFCLVYVAPNI